MKAFLLAAGVGTRLRPLTDHTPKCLVPIDHRNLLEIWLDALAQAGVTEVLLNVHHHADQVAAFARTRAGKSPSVQLFHEPVLLGSAGTVAANRAFINQHEPFFVIYADNLTLFPLPYFLDFHLSRKTDFSIGLFPSPEPSSCGIATLDSQDRIVDFVEKPRNPATNWANAGIYLANINLFEHLQPCSFADFGYHVLPRLTGSMFGFRYDGFFYDIGTPERLARARQEWIRHQGSDPS